MMLLREASRRERIRPLEAYLVMKICPDLTM